jgi:hypothetical protein
VPDAELDSLFPGLTDILHSADWTPTAGSILQADPEHGGVTDDSLKAFVEARMAQGIPALHELPTSGGGAATPRVASAPVIDQQPDEGEDDEGDDGPGSEPVEPPEEPVESGGEPPEPGAVAPGQEASPDVITVDGRQLTRDQLEAFVRFSESLDADPNLQQLLTSYYTGRFDALLQPPAAAPVTPAAPDLSQAALPTGGLDLEDPNIAALVGAIQAQQAQIAQLQQATQSVATQTMARSAQEAAALMNRAAASFQKEHELSDDDIRRLRTSASRLGVLEPLMSGIDPITQVPVKPDLLSATERALEIALYADPTYRTKMVEQAMAANRERSRKRQRLAGVGGAGSGVSRTPVAPRPGTPESKSAMLAEVAAMQAGTWQDPGA